MQAPARPSPRVLLVEDDAVIGEATKLHLERNGYLVAWYADGLDAWDAFRGADADPAREADRAAYDLVLSDVMLPGIDGVTLCRRMREISTVPVVLLSARTDAIDVVNGLEAGADDYVTKPFDVQVLLARLRSVVRRTGRVGVPPRPDAEPDTMRFGDLVVDRSALEVRRGDKPVPLTPTEMRLLLELARQPGVVVSRRTLLDRVWDYEDWADDDHLVNVHVQRLRAKIGTERIETVRGFGYKLRA